MERSLTPAPLLALRVAGDGEDRDLLVPGDVPVVELLAELVGGGGTSAGSGRAPSGRLVRVDGTPVRPGLGLREQGVLDGTVLTLVAADARTDDDAVDDAVDAVHAALSTRSGRRSGARFGVMAPRTSGSSVGGPLLVGLLGVLSAGSLVPSPLLPAHRGGTLVLVLAGVLAVVIACGAVLSARVSGDVRAASTGLGVAVLVVAAATLPGAPSVPDLLVRAGVLLGLLALALGLAFPRRPDAALAPALAALGALGSAGALHVAPLSTLQVAAVCLGACALVVRAVPWVAVAAAGVDRSTQVASAGRHRPGSLGGVDLDVVADAVDRARRMARAGTWGLGAVATAAAGVVARSGHGGLLLVACLGLLLVSVESRSEPGLRVARWSTGGAVLGVGWLSAGAGVPGAVPVVLGAAALVAGAVVAQIVTGAAAARSGRDPGGVGEGSALTVVGGRLRPAADVVAYAAVPALVACTLGLLPTPWGLP